MTQPTNHTPGSYSSKTTPTKTEIRKFVRVISAYGNSDHQELLDKVKRWLRSNARE